MIASCQALRLSNKKRKQEHCTSAHESRSHCVSSNGVGASNRLPKSLQIYLRAIQVSFGQNTQSTELSKMFLHHSGAPLKIHIVGQPFYSKHCVSSIIFHPNSQRCSCFQCGGGLAITRYFTTVIVAQHRNQADHMAQLNRPYLLQKVRSIQLSLGV